MGTQKAIAEQIIDSGADYVLALKGNQEDIASGQSSTTSMTNHKRFLPTRRRAGTPLRKKATPRRSPQLHSDAGAGESARIGNVERLENDRMATLVCMRNGKETAETRFFISSLPMGVKLFARAIRSHWGIENSCHWSLDMIYREDESRIREPQMRENFAWLKSVHALALKATSGQGQHRHEASRLRLE